MLVESTSVSDDGSGQGLTPRPSSSPGNDPTAIDLRRLKKRATNRESARRMRALRKSQWEDLTLETARLRLENERLRALVTKLQGGGGPPSPATAGGGAPCPGTPLAPATPGVAPASPLPAPVPFSLGPTMLPPGLHTYGGSAPPSGAASAAGSARGSARSGARHGSGALATPACAAAFVDAEEPELLPVIPAGSAAALHSSAAATALWLGTTVPAGVAAAAAARGAAADLGPSGGSSAADVGTVGAVPPPGNYDFELERLVLIGDAVPV